MINDPNILARLTPSAQRAIDELTDTYKKSLIEQAFQNAKSRGTADKEISLTDIIESQRGFLTEASHQTKLKEQQSDYKRKRVYVLLTLVGSLYTIAGIGLYIFQNKSFALEDNVGLLTAAVGVITIIMSFTLNQLSLIKRINPKKASELENIDDYDIVRRWQLIEHLTLEIMKERNLVNQKSNPVSQVMGYLKDHTALQGNENSIQALLHIRNKILHEGYVLTADEKKHFKNLADEIIKRLETLKN